MISGHHLTSVRFFHSRFFQFTRLMGTDVLNSLPQPVYRLAVYVIKMLLGQKRLCKTALPVIPTIRSMPAHQRPHAKIWLTHDIDTKQCYDYWPEVLAQEEACGLFSTSHVLTHGPYMLASDLCKKWHQKGFEIGLHGDTHDMAIGYRCTRSMQKKIRRGVQALSAMGIAPKSYRAPALGASEKLLNVLEEAGFACDSSIKTQLYYRKGVQMRSPYHYPHSKITEAPLTIQDTNLFVDFALSETEALDYLDELITYYKHINGTLVINTHPIHLQKRPHFYPALLKKMRDDAELSVMHNSDDVVLHAQTLAA